MAAPRLSERTTGSVRFPLWVTGCLPECVSTTAAVPHIAADLLQHHTSAAWGQFRTHALQQGSLFDHRVCAGEKRRGNFHAERPCGLEIDDERVLVGLLYGEVGRFGAFQDSIDIMGSKPGNR